MRSRSHVQHSLVLSIVRFRYCDIAHWDESSHESSNNEELGFARIRSSNLRMWQMLKTWQEHAECV